MLKVKRVGSAPSSLVTGLVWGTVMLLAVIGVAAAVGRMLSLGRGAGPPPSDPTDVGYVKSPLLTMFHVVPGVLFLALGPLQFVRRIRARHPRFHRRSGRVF